MKIDLAAAARVVPITALMLGACVSQSAYDQFQKQNQQLQSQNQQLQAQVAGLEREASFVEAAHSGDCDRPFQPKVITDSGDRDHAVASPSTRITPRAKKISPRVTSI